MKRSLCVVFDIDDTLYLQRDYVRSGFETVGHWADKWLHTEDFGRRCWSRFSAGNRRSVFNDVLSEIGREPTPELVQALVEIYRTHTPSIKLAPDASEALPAISDFADLAVISDGPVASQSRKAEALDLGAFAAPILLTETLGTGFRKPHPGAFEHVKRCRPANLHVYVADNPLKDFAAPRQLGWLTIRVRRPGGLHYAVENSDLAPDLQLTDCSGLPKMLAQL
jgi:putative hydrolase of the HAD superfamily